jgi:hypothetical protein
MKLLAWLIAGTIFAIVASALIGLATLHLHPGFGAVSTFLAADVVALAIAIAAPTSGKAWRRLFVLSGVLALALPLGGVVLTGTNLVDPAGAGAAGTVIVGGGVTVLAGFVGFFLGAILLVLGFACGKMPRDTIASQ